MRKRVLAGVFLSICLLFPGGWMNGISLCGQTSASSSVGKNGTLRAQLDLGKAPVNFIPNRGQTDEKFAYYVQGKDKAIGFSSDGVTFVLTGRKAGAIATQAGREMPAGETEPNRPGIPGPSPESDSQSGSRWVVNLDFLGANAGVQPVGTDPNGTIISFFSGEPGTWKTGLAASSRITYANLWQGIDLVYTGTADALKYEFIVHPGADPSRIRLAYRGATSVLVNDDGRLAVSTPVGGFEDGTPVAYQELEGRRQEIPLAYNIADETGGKSTADGSGGVDRSVAYGFAVGTYDRTRPLILDPVVLIYCGYLGGPGNDYGYGIAADSLGRAYITGYTYSMGVAFPAVVGPDLSYNGGSVDAFIARVNASGTGLDYCGYIGGLGNDFAYGVAVDKSGSAYVTGYTSSTEASFPVKVGPNLRSRGLFDVFVAKVAPDGRTLVYCGFIGGDDDDFGRAIAVDNLGRAYIAGYSASTETTFPAAVGPRLVFGGGTYDAFIARVNAAGTKLDYCGYVGGLGNDYGYGVACDKIGNAYITGCTNSMEASFPVLTGPDQTYNGGKTDAFIARITNDGVGFDYCGYIGGAGDDCGYGVAVDSSLNAYVTGSTSSSSDSFPVQTGPFLTHSGGTYDAFIAKVYTDGSVMYYCGYIGGADYDTGTAVAVDGFGFAYVTGYTASKEDSFPVKDGPVLTLGGSFDAFVAKVKVNATGLVYCGYLGGADADLAQGIALDADGTGNVFLTGNTFSRESTFPATLGPTLVASGSRDGFAARVLETSLTITAPNGAEMWKAGAVNNITWITEGKVGNVRIEFSSDNATTWSDVVASTKNDGTFAWKVADTISSECLIRISDVDTGVVTDTSDAVFSVVTPTITVTSPNGGEKWAVGVVHNITWTSEGTVSDVRIELTTDSGSTWEDIVSQTENDGVYAWTVPNKVSSSCMIRISDVVTGLSTDTSDTVFSIVVGAVTVNSPNGGESWTVGSRHDITWSSEGTVSDVRIELSTDSGSTWEDVVAQTQNNGLYSWTIPDKVSSTCLIRISDVVTGLATDTSDAVFSIVAASAPPAAPTKGGAQIPIKIPQNPVKIK